MHESQEPSSLQINLTWLQPTRHQTLVMGYGASLHEGLLRLQLGATSWQATAPETAPCIR